MSRIFLAAVGNCNDPSTWSGTPFHLLQAGKEAGFLHGGLDLSVPAGAFKLVRYFWNAWELLNGRGRGYQYSDYFLNGIWRAKPAFRPGDRIINLFQLFPNSIHSNDEIDRIFYIDQTLRQLFGFYPEASHVSLKRRQIAVEKERAQYERASKIITLCQWAANSVINDYGIDPGRVSVVLPGANLDALAYAQWERNRSRALSNGYCSHKPGMPMRFVFVGMDGVRKGLNRLLEAMEIIPQVEQRMLLSVIGANRRSVSVSDRVASAVSWIGIVSKGTQTTEFLNIVGSCDVGVLLSRAEAAGISLREFQSLGLAVLGPNVGGSPEMIVPGAGLLVSPKATKEEVATLLESIVDNPSKVERMKRAAWQKRKTMSWFQTVDALRVQIT